MNKIQLYKMGRGFVPVGEEAEAVYGRMSPGEIGWFKPMRVRDPVAHGRYWQLMTMCAQNCERIELPYGAVMIIHGKGDVHTAIKFCTGLCDTVFDAFGKPAFQIPKSTDFESMTADEWAEYWPKVLDVVEACRVRSDCRMSATGIPRRRLRVTCAWSASQAPA